MKLLLLVKNHTHKVLITQDVTISLSISVVQLVTTACDPQSRSEYGRISYCPPPAICTASPMLTAQSWSMSWMPPSKEHDIARPDVIVTDAGCVARCQGAVYTIDPIFPVLRYEHQQFAYPHHYCSPCSLDRCWVECSPGAATLCNVERLQHGRLVCFLARLQKTWANCTHTLELASMGVASTSSTSSISSLLLSSSSSSSSVRSTAATPTSSYRSCTAKPILRTSSLHTACVPMT